MLLTFWSLFNATSLSVKYCVRHDMDAEWSSQPVNTVLCSVFSLKNSALRCYNQLDFDDHTVYFNRLLINVHHIQYCDAITDLQLLQAADVGPTD